MNSYCLNYIRRDQNSTYKTGKTLKVLMSQKIFDIWYRTKS